MRKRRGTKSGGDTTALESEIARLKARVAELERGSEVVSLSTAARDSRRMEFDNLSEEATLRRNVAILKSDVLRLKEALQEEPDLAKLRQKVVDQRLEIAQLKRDIKRLAKERDKLQIRATRRRREAEAEKMLTAASFRLLVKVVHSDRAAHSTAAELAAAERIVIAMRPLFIEE
jgi:hypothetical protein